MGRDPIARRRLMGRRILVGRRLILIGRVILIRARLTGRRLIHRCRLIDGRWLIGGCWIVGSKLRALNNNFILLIRIRRCNKVLSNFTRLLLCVYCGFQEGEILPGDLRIAWNWITIRHPGSCLGVVPMDTDLPLGAILRDVKICATGEAKCSCSKKPQSAHCVDEG